MKKLAEAIRTFINLHKHDWELKKIENSPNNDFYFEVEEARDHYTEIPYCCIIRDR